MTFTSPHSRKNQRVYRSPSDPNDPSPYQKKLDMDAEDKEAGTILMALAHHKSQFKKPTSHHAMSIRHLLAGLDDDTHHSSRITSGPVSNPFYESRRQSNLKKGFKICLSQRGPVSFRHPSTVSFKKPSTKSPRKSTTHIHISYRIHAHKLSTKCKWHA
ncbi:uncharacterized protein B0P05DRAFT_573627 [Gilbertella persicaria]|uniref:uncharacterized protein n=1 Tax=Gilbertella persicaria TaxID=101096 RepID=UPI00221EEB25|nr:uncharacterized protein B0P05DRAFT_573627 [Gilbertella persicaria]KAI8068133.1 hypothetical protein B0P05DRAFT_573627 [Gilbertella persicaria]